MAGSGIEVAYVVIYLLAMIGVGAIVARRAKGSDEFIAGGRRMPYWLVTGTLFATWWGGGTMLGSAGAAYYDGFHGIIYEPIGAGLTLVLAGFFFMKIIHDAKVNSLAQFFTARYDASVTRVAAVVMIPTYALFTAVNLVAIGKVFEFVLGWPYAVTILLGTAVILAYTIMGGILAVAWTDIFQVVLVVIGLVVLLPLGIRAVGGWDELVAHTPGHFFKLFPAEGSELAPPTLSGWLWWFGALLGVGLGSLSSPELYQRAIIARSGKTAAAASVTAGAGYWVFGVIPVYLAFVVITLIAQGNLPASLIDVVNEDSETLILVLIRHTMVPAVGGIFIASLLAMIMSTGDSAIFATGTVIANDVVKPIVERSRGTAVSDRDLVRYTRISIGAFTVVALLVGFLYENMYDLLIVAFQLLFHILFFPLVLGVYWKKANTPGAIAGMVVGFLAIFIWMIGAGSLFPEPEWLSTLGPGVLGGVTMVVVSLATQAKKPAKPLTATDGTVLKFGDLR